MQPSSPTVSHVLLSKSSPSQQFEESSEDEPLVGHIKASKGHFMMSSSSPVKSLANSLKSESSTDGDSEMQVDSMDVSQPNHDSSSHITSNGRQVESHEEEDDDEDVPLKKRHKSNPKQEETEEDSDESFVKTKKLKKVKSQSVKSDNSKTAQGKTKSKKSKKLTSDNEEDEDEPLKKRKKSVKKVKTEIVKSPKDKSNDKETKGSKQGKKKVKEEEEEEETYKWWLEENRDDSIKWNSLKWNGVLFPPDYVPHGIKMKYEGKEASLSPESEEVASFFAALLETDYVKNPTFVKNFFSDFLKLIKEHEPSSCPIKEFEKCDFTPIFHYLETQKEVKKNMSKEEKLQIKQEKLKIDEQYGFAYLDNRKEKMGNYRIEPPGLFRGRGEHPKTGCLKSRVQPEQITINIGENDPVPEPPTGHKWGQIIHDNKVTWLAFWKENVNDNFKYVFLAANSSLKGQSDYKKFEKARELKNHIDRIRKQYTEELKDKQMFIRQRATALHLIDRFALRAGNEKGEDEADTVGCCSLRFEHVTLEPPNKVIFDFLGKDSIRYYNQVEVNEQVFKNLKIFKREPKKEGDLLFDRLNTMLMNKHLSSCMPGLTAKVFRTFNASYTFQEELKKTPEDASIAEKLLAYNRANRQVAILCNHQRAVAKSFGNQMTKLKDKLLGLKYERQLIKNQMLELEPKFKKSRPEIAQQESDLDDEFIQNYEKFLEEKDAKQLELKLAKENEKRKEAGEEPLKELKKKTTSPVLDLDKLEKKLEQISARIATMRTNMIDRDENKTTALGTSKINYIDPRISAAWCDRHGVSIEKIFPKTLREKFKWAMDADKDYVF